ncbi:hypothetical protein C8Q76DRAFT_246043 [Earliella scabrosa]|nr:hypothetical protein C8Q76DRAFT_246043 [Earliella scabrosa]
MAIRKITFTSTNLGDNAKLMLCFIPPTAEAFVTQFPIAWKVTTLQAKRKSELNAIWSSTPGFCEAEIDSNKMMNAGNYTPIDAGQSTTLLLDESTSSPTYHWTDPKATGGVAPGVQAVNGTGDIANIGLGFITDLDGSNELMDPTVVYPNVVTNRSVKDELPSVLSAYVAVGDYEESQIIPKNILNYTPVWKGDLISLGEHTTIIITKNRTGGYKATQRNGVVSDDVLAEIAAESEPTPEPVAAAAVGVEGESFGARIPLWEAVDTRLLTGKRQYEATLAFAVSRPSDIGRGLKIIIDYLLARGYAVEVIAKENDNDVNVTLGLPYSASCRQAETDIVSATEAIGFPGRVAIKKRAGAIRLFLHGLFNYWADINPASPEWVASNKHIRSEESTGETVGNGDAQNGLNGDATPVTYGKTRVGKKGPSSVASSSVA